MTNSEILLTNQVDVGDEFKNYSDLCKHIGIPVTTGKQRQLSDCSGAGSVGGVAYPPGDQKGGLLHSFEHDTFHMISSY